MTKDEKMEIAELKEMVKSLKEERFLIKQENRKLLLERKRFKEVIYHLTESLKEFSYNLKDQEDKLY